MEASNPMGKLVAIPLLALAGVIGCYRTNESTATDNAQRQKKMSDNEGLARKQRSMKRLRAVGVPVNEGLPIIETEAESKCRTTEQAALRAMTLCIVASRAEGLDDEMTK